MTTDNRTTVINIYIQIVWILNLRLFTSYIVCLNVHLVNFQLIPVKSHKFFSSVLFCVRALGVSYRGVFSALQIPPADINKDIVSFRLQKLQPDTLYTIQLRCKNARRGPYWSDWSTNATKRTAEDSELDF